MTDGRIAAGGSHRVLRLAVAVMVVLMVGGLALLGLLGTWGLGLAPVFVLAIALLAGRYPGERLIERWQRTLRRRRPSATPSTVQPLGLAVAVRGGRLIAVALAGRGPPTFAPG